MGLSSISNADNKGKQPPERQKSGIVRSTDWRPAPVAADSHDFVHHHLGRFP